MEVDSKNINSKVNTNHLLNVEHNDGLNLSIVSCMKLCLFMSLLISAHMGNVL